MFAVISNRYEGFTVFVGMVSFVNLVVETGASVETFVVVAFEVGKMVVAVAFEASAHSSWDYAWEGVASVADIHFH